MADVAHRRKPVRPSPVPSSPFRVAVALGLASSLLLLFGCARTSRRRHLLLHRPSTPAASPSAPSATHTLCLEDAEAQVDQGVEQLRQGAA